MDRLELIFDILNACLCISLTFFMFCLFFYIGRSIGVVLWVVG